MPTFDHGAATIAPVAIGVPVLGAAVLLVLGRFVPRAVLDAGAAVFGLATTAITALVFEASTSGRLVEWVAAWTPHKGTSVGVVLVVDPVGAGFALASSALTLLALFHSQRYVESVHGHYHSLVLLFLAGMVGLSLSGDVFDMFGFFELMGAATYALTGMKVEEEVSLQGALNFGIVNSLGAYVTLMGIGLLLARTGHLDLPGLGQAIGHHRPDALVVAAFCLVVTGFLVKAAVTPFHFWLADAHAVAPAPVCMLFSGAMVPLGVYATFRIYWVVFGGTLPVADVRRTFIVLGVLTAVVGALMALVQQHVKRLLAYATIAHVGLFVVAMGSLSRAGTAGMLAYAAGYAGAAGALFLLTGNLLGMHHTVDEHELFGRGTDRRTAGALFVLAALAVAALPPFGTALGREMSSSALSGLGYLWAPALFLGVPALTGGAALRAGLRIFFGLGRPPATRTAAVGGDSGSGRATTEEEKPGAALEKVPWSMAAPPALLVGASLAVGLVPGVRAGLVRAAAIFVNRGGYIAQALYGAHVGLPAASAPHPQADWSAAGVGLGLVAAAAAAGVAAAALYGHAVVDRFGWLRWFRAPVQVLHRLHSGHVGDYVAWMLVGIVALAGFVGLPVR